MISCRTLGPLEITVDGRHPPPELKRTKLQALLVYMAFAPRHTRSKEHVMGVLWPDAKKPTASLNEARYLLKYWGGAVIADEGGQLRLDPSTVVLDITQFDQLVRERRWSQAAAMVEGLLLDGFAPTKTSGFDEWLGAERDRWRNKCGEALVHEAEALLDGGAPERAEPIAERAQRLVAHSDAAVRTYLKVLALLGRRSEALEVGDRFVKRIAKDLGTRPEDATIRLLEAIKTIKIRPSETSLKKDRRGPLIGRSAQLGRVLGAWRATLAGEANVVLVWGDPGMGKTRFLLETVERARMDRAAIGISRAVPGDTNHPWIGLVTMAEGGLLQAPGVAAAPPAAVAALGARSSLWAEKFPVSAPAALDLSRAMTEVARAAAAEGPVLLVVDDAQWMDGESLQGLLGMARDLAKMRVMLLLAVHADPPRDELEELRARIGRDLKGVSVTLEALTHADLVALAHWALPQYDADQLDRIARRVSVESGGLPLIAYEIFTAVADGLELHPLSKPWPPPKRTLHDALPTELPDNLVGAIKVGFGRLTTDAKAVLRALAVLGDPCRSDRLGRGSDLPASRVERALDQLEWQRWLVADARGYSYLARAIRDVVKEKLMPKGEAHRVQGRVIGA